MLCVTFTNKWSIVEVMNWTRHPMDSSWHNFILTNPICNAGNEMNLILKVQEAEKAKAMRTSKLRC